MNINEFLSSDINGVIIFFAYLEITVFFALILIGLDARIYYYFKDKKTIKEKKIISQILIDGLEGRKNITQTVNKLRVDKCNLLSQLIAFDLCFKGDEWDVIKNAVSHRYLLPKARKSFNSMFWKNRMFSARSFFLTPCLEDGGLILKLLEDPVFLVRSRAAFAAVRLQRKEFIEKVLQKMSAEEGYAHYFYRDILLENSSEQLFTWVQEILISAPPPLQLACLEILMGKYFPLALTDLTAQLNSEDPEIHLAAIKVLAHNPQKNSSEILRHALKDPDDRCRAVAAQGLENFERVAQ